ncbi:MAG TPA: histidine kinase dimerization/phospho-acceptor domain-containing protein, partial [Anaerolineales bacterium]|nr:histidine kinase dimerization/phospho-acceptor domain-containing protein [Anaerolineales bacterium]
MLTSLRVRLILSHLAVIFVAMAASGFLLLSLMEQYLLQAVEDSLIAQGRIVAEVLIPNTNVGGPVVEGQASAYNAFQQNSLRTFSLQTQNVSVPPISTLSRDLTYLTDASLQLNSQLITRIRIVDAQGTVLVDTRGERGKSLLDDPLVAQGLQGIYAQAVGAGEGESDTAMYIVLPVTGQGEVIGTIYLSQSLRDTTAVLNDVRTRLLISAGIALLVSALVGLILSQAVSKPVRQLTATAEAIAQGKPLAEVASQKEAISKPSDEIGRLRISFFNMLARLQAANRTQTDFVANVSHELRTPLTSIKGLVETLRDGAKDDLAVRDKFLETVGGETDRLIRLVNDLLILSRADSQALTLNLEDVDLL